MIKSQENFERALPADFDGVFDWDALKYFLLRGIEPMDLDAAMRASDGDAKARNINAMVQLPRPPSVAQLVYGFGPARNQTHIMGFETKKEGASIPRGQWDTLRVCAWTGLFTVVAMWRKDFAGPFEWLWMHRDDNGQIHTSHPRTTPAFIFLHFFAVWAAAADAYYTHDALFRVLIEWDTRSNEQIEIEARGFIETMREIYLDEAKRCMFLSGMRNSMLGQRSRFL